ncbi:MAG: anthranilate phosphoribosyltransferase [Dehalococcoidia bacterium]|nr:anthranilate phosphoribosyltransferase [Dehalococcoidia bacterium]
MIKDALIALVDERRDLTEREAHDAMREMMRAGLDGAEGAQATPAQFGSFVTAMRLKGETVEELAGMARAMRDHALQLDVKAQPLLDTAGTGGSRKVFNASTAGAFVAAACGVKVAKHGNRGMTSKSGAADFLEALGAEIALGPEGVAQCIDKVGMGFLFAQTFHPAMKFAGPLRPQLGFRTLFNIMGPLTNPARAKSHVMGAANTELAERLAHVLARMEMRHAIVAVGADGVDDISVVGPTQLFEVRGAQVTSRTITPFDLGLSVHQQDEITGGDAKQNAAIMRQVFAGDGPVAVRDMIAAQAGAGIHVTGLAASLKDGVKMALQAIEDGDAAAKVAAFVEATRRAAGR